MKKAREWDKCQMNILFFLVSTFFVACFFSLNEIWFERRLWRLDKEVEGIGESLGERWRSVSAREGGGKAGGRERQRVRE